MTTSTSRNAYDDCFSLLDRALDSAKGIANRVETEGAGRHLRTRLHYARTLDRRDSTAIYEQGEPGYGTSVYDGLVVRIKQDGTGWWVYIEPRAVQGEIRELAAE